MNKPNILNNFAFFERTYAELRQTQPAELAMEKIEKQSRKVNLVGFVAWLSWRSEPESPKTNNDQNASFLQWLPRQRKPGEDKNFTAVFESLDTFLTPSWGKLLGSAAYLAFLLVFFSFIAAIYYGRVYPSLTSLMSELSLSEKAITELAPVSLSLFYIFVIAVVLLILAYNSIQNRVASLGQIPPFLRRLPFAKPVIEKHDMLTVIVQAYLNDEFTIPKLKEICEKQGFDWRQIKYTLEKDFPQFVVACDVGTQEIEVNYTIKKIAEQLAIKLDKLRSTLMITTQCLMFIIIALVLVSMYLPIFQIGQII